ncbi:alpha/beta hydrolase family protein [Dyella silvatica]|uniref:alpha/beta hydrolase family protein n=1 Tax=Dyella silvatica TaxID=2992128 RepID=UPI002250BBF6|nr:S9 family peptidase [Dyella silvatica]
MLPALAAADTAHVDPRIENLLAGLGKQQTFDSVALSPDGQQLAWVVHGQGRPTIEVAQIDGSKVRHVGLSEKPLSCSETDVSWAPDSRHLAFLSDCGSRTAGAEGRQKNLYVTDTRSDAAPRRLATLSGYAHALRWSRDGKSVGFLYVVGATRRASALAAARPSIGEIGVDGLEIQRVATVSADGGEVHQLSPAQMYVYEFSWSPDAGRIAYIGAPPPGDNNWWVAKLYVQNAQPDAAATTLVDPATVTGPLKGLQMALPIWSPDGSQIAFIGGLMSDEGFTGGDIYSVASAGGAAPVNLTPGIHVTPSWLAWTDAQQLLVAQFSNGQSQVAEYTIADGAAKPDRILFTLPATIGDGSAEMGLSLSRDQRQIAFVQSSYNTAAEVHAGALGTQAPPAVTSINAGLKQDWGKAESVEWDHDGRHIQGWLLYPADYDASKSYPMIVDVHGGPSGAVIPRWPNVGFGGVPFSALGYFVFMPNPRGSYGQGEAFVQANRKDFGYGDLRDVLAGVDAIEKKYPIDDKRLGLTGWSYGGFMTMFGVTQTSRFRAAVAGAGIANWQSYYGQNLIDQWMTPFFGASVYDDPQVYAKSSAINFIKQVKTPTLVVVGERDAECPAPQSFEFWHALRAQSVPTSLVVYPNEGHRFANPANQRDVLQRALLWFQKYL